MSVSLSYAGASVSLKEYLHPQKRFQVFDVENLTRTRKNLEALIETSKCRKTFERFFILCWRKRFVKMNTSTRRNVFMSSKLKSYRASAEIYLFAFSHSLRGGSHQIGTQWGGAHSLNVSTFFAETIIFCNFAVGFNHSSTCYDYYPFHYRCWLIFSFFCIRSVAVYLLQTESIPENTFSKILSYRLHLIHSGQI